MRGWLRALFLTGLFMLALLLSPALAVFVGQTVSVPALRALASLSGRFAFPVLFLPAALLIALICLLKPRVLAGALAFVMLFGALWYPLMVTGEARAELADSDAVFRLCASLISELNESGRAVIPPDEALRTAREVMGTPAAAKAARYPEWMRAISVAGMFVPFTGEALVDATRNEVALPFTAAHELAHMLGVADEGAANLLAYEKSLSHGGAFAYSARLWALKYALARVENPGEVVRALDDAILRDLSAIPSVTGVDGDYGDVVDRIIMDMGA